MHYETKQILPLCRYDQGDADVPPGHPDDDDGPAIQKAKMSVQSQTAMTSSDDDVVIPTDVLRRQSQ